MRSICVFCGADEGNREIYRLAARNLGELLGENGYALVYGGGAVGLMGIMADAVLAKGGRVVGVVPDFFVGTEYNGNEVVHSGLTELKVVPSMHERKAMMLELSDAFITMPGGLGTIDELVEMWTLAKLGIHTKPCALLNVAGYFDHFLGFVDEMVEQGFVGAEDRSLLLLEEDPELLLKKLAGYKSSFVPNLQCRA